MTLNSLHNRYFNLRLSILGLASLIAITCWGADVTTDSLTLSGQLNALSKYKERYKLLSDALDTLDTNNPFYMVVANRLWNEAASNKDYETQNYIGYTQAIYYFNNAQTEKIEQVLENMRGLFHHIKDYSYYFYVFHLTIIDDIEAANFEYAIAKVKKMELEMGLYPHHQTKYLIYQTWGHIYDNFNENQKAISAYRKALKLIPKEDFFEGRSDIQSELLSLYIKMKMYLPADSLIQTLSTYYGVNLNNPDSSKIGRWDADYAIDTYCSAADIKLHHGDTSQAKVYLNHADSLINSTTYSPYKSYYHEVLAEYLSQKKDSLGALRAIDTAINTCSMTELGWSDYIQLIQKKSKLQIKFNDLEGGTKSYARSIQLIDLIDNISANQQYTQLKALYNFDAQRFANQKHQRNYLILGCVLGLITLLIAARHWYKFHIIRQRELESVHQIKEAKATADKANKAKYEFLQAFNHNIRTPLNAVIGFTDLMVTSPHLSNKDLHGYATCIHRNSQKILTTVGNLLELSRMESNMVQLSHEITTVENFVESLRLRMEIKNIGAFIIHDKVEMYHKIMTLDTHRFGQLFDSFLSAYGNDETTPDNVIIETYFDKDDIQKKEQVVFKITGSSLIMKKHKKDVDQERTVRNTINSIVVKRTGGQYMQSEEQIMITLPIHS